jgi:hypothetical protein
MEALKTALAELYAQIQGELDVVIIEVAAEYMAKSLSKGTNSY